MKDSSPKMIYLTDYKKTDYSIYETHLTLDLDDHATQVQSKLLIKKNAGVGKTLFLNGERLTLLEVKLDGVVLNNHQYTLTSNGLELQIDSDKDQFVLEIKNSIDPKANKTLEGLYKSGDIFCTQCEAEGFRCITYYQDRPDVMSIFTTTVVAPKKAYPLLLSNGNLVEEGEWEGGKHFAKWHDPFPKPAYLFAMVAGDLGMIEDKFTTASKRQVVLRIYCDKGNEKKCWHAMESAKKAMKWDEERFGLEYDLDMYMIVAVDAFNFGAMENKGLNIFNSAYVLADQESATDDNFLAIEGVVAHEYFHNWTGNRVTCRDWFQLTLKEGLTVYRDQEFSSDMNSKVVQRIGDVEKLKRAQFSEDAGPNAHPIRPKAYASIDNFYTPTIYEKGSEVIRMIEAIVGLAGFRKGIDKYFELYDGQAVTTDDFVHAMSVANNCDLEQFKRWYSSAGTPLVSVQADYEEEQKRLVVKISQTRPVTRHEDQKTIEQNPLHIPFFMGLIDSHGVELKHPMLAKGMLTLKKNEETFVFDNIPSKPLLSLNRGFRAPIKVQYPYSVKELATLMAYDTDGFNRYEAQQQLAIRLIKGLVTDLSNGHQLRLHEAYFEAFASLLADTKIDPAFKAKCLHLPGLDIIGQEFNPVDYHALHKVLSFMKESLAKKYAKELGQLYNQLAAFEGAYKLDPQSMGQRSLKNTLLSYLFWADQASGDTRAYEQFEKANNMTEKILALALLAQRPSELTTKALSQFYNKWKDTPLVIQKWFSIQAQSRHESTLERVKKLESDPAFDITIPNFTRSLIGALGANSVCFHYVDDKNKGAAYEYLAQKVLQVDAFNPQLASRLMSPFNDFARLPQKQQKTMKVALETIHNASNVSTNVREILSKILA